MARRSSLARSLSKKRGGVPAAGIIALIAIIAVIGAGLLYRQKGVRAMLAGHFNVLTPSTQILPPLERSRFVNEIQYTVDTFRPRTDTRAPGNPVFSGVSKDTQDIINDGANDANSMLRMVQPFVPISVPTPVDVPKLTIASMGPSSVCGGIGIDRTGATHVPIPLGRSAMAITTQLS